MTANMFTDKE